MPKITINLLPEEFRHEELKRVNFYKIQSIGVGVIMLFIFLATLVIALRMLQSQSIQEVQAKLTNEEQKVAGFKKTQASVVFLKNRLTAINKYLGVSSKPVETYQFINEFLPPSITASNVSVDKAGDISLLVLSPDATSVDDLIDKLTTSEEARSKIVSVSLEGLNKGRDGVYRLSLKIKTKS